MYCDSFLSPPDYVLLMTSIIFITELTMQFTYTGMHVHISSHKNLLTINIHEINNNKVTEDLHKW